jgi:hypothetical protein
MSENFIDKKVKIMNNKYELLLLNLFLTLFFILSPFQFAFGNVDIVDIGELKIPPPQNMVNATDYSEKFRILFKAAPEKCFAQYYLKNEISDISQNLIPTATKMAYGNLSSISTSREDAENLFIKDMVDLKLNLRDIILHKNEIEELILSGKKRVESKIPGLSVDILDSKYVDLDLSKAWRGSFTIIGNGVVDVDGQSLRFSIASANGWLLVDRTTLHLIYNVILKDINSLAEAKNGLNAWMDSIKEMNAH